MPRTILIGAPIDEGQRRPGCRTVLGGIGAVSQHDDGHAGRDTRDRCGHIGHGLSMHRCRLVRDASQGESCIALLNNAVLIKEQT